MKVACNISFNGFTERRVVPNNIAITLSFSLCTDIRRIFLMRYYKWVQHYQKFLCYKIMMIYAMMCFIMYDCTNFI